MTTLRQMLMLRWSGMIAGARIAPTASIQHPASSNQHRGASRRGVTLVELLITMTIMAIIAAAILGTAAAAIEGAREKKTQSLITKLHTLLMERYASYETRRVEINRSWTDPIEQMARSGAITPAERGQMLADLRLLAQRELMKYEMPDRWSDVTANPVFLVDRPPLAKEYLRRSANATGENNPAECLYMTIMLATGDGEARTLFSKQDIGDTDDDPGPDGAPEFIDGWGNPIQYLRWAPGYVPNSGLMVGDAQKDHDPFDVYRRDDPTALPAISRYPSSWRPYIEGLKDQYPAFRLVPLIFSAGSVGIEDGKIDIFISPEKIATSTGSNEPALNPFFIDSSLSANADKFGIPSFGYGLPDKTDDVDDSKSYITNHNIEF